MVEVAEQNGYKKRIAQFGKYIQNFNQELTEYDEQLVRLYIKKITVYDDHYEVEFKTGFKLNIKR